MYTLDDILSERFIHTDLARLAEAGVKSLYETWKNERKIYPFLVTWPGETIKTDEGVRIEGPCHLPLPEDKKVWNGVMLEAIKRTKAYAVLLVEQRDQDVRVILESPHGAKCWTLPIVRSGDVFILGNQTSTVDKEHLGLLWSPKNDKARPS
jgi:hypothetical protein